MESGRQNKIIVILGPTASGKSVVAIKLARKFNGEIISADSRQIYHGMNIGAGTVNKAEQKMARHHLLDYINPKTDYNVFRFKKDAEKVIEAILALGKVPILCGGTGFWIKAIADNVIFAEVKPDKVLRNKLRNKSAAQLFAMLKKLDPKRAANIDAKNKARMIRAIEICKAIGKVPPVKSSPRYDVLQIGLDLSKDKLNQNIQKRLRQRWQAGMIKEVEKLKKSGLGWKKIQSFGLGYFWIPLYLQDKLSKKELYEKVYLAEKDYAKRQMTWFRKDNRIHWLKKIDDIEKMTRKFLAKNKNPD